jgi:hypothetical protein
MVAAYSGRFPNENIAPGFAKQLLTAAGKHDQSFLADSSNLQGSLSLLATPALQRQAPLKSPTEKNAQVTT